MSIIHNVKGYFMKRFLNTGAVFFMDIIGSLVATMSVLVLVSILVPDFELGQENTLLWMGLSFVASVLSFRLYRVYRAIIRYSTLREIGRLSIAVLGKEMFLFILMGFISPMGFTCHLLASMVFIDFFITVGALMLIRVLMVVLYDRVKSDIVPYSQIKRVLVYGTNDKAVSMVSRLRHSPHYKVCGFIIYGQNRVGHQLSGLKVNYFETPSNLKIIAATEAIEGILFPYVADARLEQDRLIKYCQEANLRTYIMPGVDEMTEGKQLNNYIRKIKIEDLLGRPEIKISMDEIIANFSNKVVMVTGAAGSIGSELCRQLATFGVKKLILYDNAETPLHNIRLELEDRFPQLDFVPVIGDVRSIPRLDFVFREYRPQVVFHAAAYKHVPLMEENPCEAVRVNVTGSRQVADKCVEYGVEKMVMVSTDKAVNPTNIMGCTKRLAEIYVQSLGLAIERGEIEGRTSFVTTRFGNVLGSNGSVIPRFREQIEHGGPITVTHPDINRFFMTIPEACRLVMEAATFSTGTQIFVFDMGESVKIVTLAERMIHLAGLEVGRDIKIEFTGLRPGEKLYEEVLATKENTIPTAHARIYVAKAREYPYESARDVATRLTKLAVSVTTTEMVRLMKNTVPEFKSKNSEYEKLDCPTH
ncbi:MAG: polysaccharide biosynthesis protein [Muribaculaceae bacterium]|nr:polysaccharide biosynthesis protein [Muribaculaceae bacterium]